MMKFRRGFTTYAIIECNTIDDCDDYDCSDQIVDNMEVQYTQVISDDST